MVMSLEEAPQLLADRFDLELWILLHRPCQLVVALDRRIIPKYVEDSSLQDRMFLAVGVNDGISDPFVGLLVRIYEDLQRLVLGRGDEGNVAGVGGGIYTTRSGCRGGHRMSTLSTLPTLPGVRPMTALGCSPVRHSLFFTGAMHYPTSSSNHSIIL